MSPVRRELAFFLPAAAVLAADQLSKFWVRRYLDYGESLPLEAPVRLTHIANPGGVFGLVAPPSLLVVLTLVITVLLLLAYRQPVFDRGWLRPALGMIMGGGLGNLVDRLRQGFVTDFIDLRVWPVFNLGDSAVVGGVALIVYFLVAKKH